LVLTSKNNYFEQTLRRPKLLRLFDLSLKLSGFKINEAKAYYSKIKSLTKEDYVAYQNQKKKDILKFHLAHNPFYKSFGKHIDIDDWNSVPILTKNDLQQPLENRLSRGFTKKNVYINKTSGSSGHPFVFAKDKWCHALTWAEIMDRFSWYNIDFNKSKQARFYGIPLEKKGYFKERIKDKLSNRYRFSIFDLTDITLNKALKKFEKIPFEYINGYTSAIVQFAKFLDQRNTVLKDICPSLSVCIVTAEMLFPDDKKLLETTFGVPIVNEYGASELGLLAFQNPEGEWPLNIQTLHIEILDENNNPVSVGDQGRIIVTSLFNKAHPFIRYDLGDIGQISMNGKNNPILEKLTGRTNDIALLPSGKKAAGLTFYYITKSVIEDDGNVSEFIVEQNNPSTFTIIYCSKTALTQEKKRFISKEMQTYLEPGLTIEFKRVDSLQRTNSGKLKQFKRLF
jgi:phenylacetate-CoA ligase